MLRGLYRGEHRPKSLEAIEEVIYNGSKAFPEATDLIAKFEYRKMFGMTAQEMAEEPIDQFFINSFIYAHIRKKEAYQQNAK